MSLVKGVSGTDIMGIMQSRWMILIASRVSQTHKLRELAKVVKERGSN